VCVQKFLSRVKRRSVSYPGVTFARNPRKRFPTAEPNATELLSCAPISARAAQRRRRRRWWWCVVGSLLLGHTPSAPPTPSTKGKRFGAARVCWACCPRAAWRGRHGRVLIVFEMGGKKENCHLSGDGSIYIHGQATWAIGNGPPMCAHMPLPALRSHTPGRRPRTPG